MAKTTVAPKEKVENVENAPVEENKTISLMPNWENTKTWLMLCKQMLSQRDKKESLTSLFRKVDNAATEAEKFLILANAADEQIKKIEKKLETLKSISEIARYENALCLKRDVKPWQKQKIGN